MSPWMLFVLSAAAIVVAGRELSNYGDQLAKHTGLGRAFVGSILLAGATSLPEVVASGSAAYQGWGNLAMGNVFGSNIFNMVLLVIAQILVGRRPILSIASPNHITVAASGILLSGIAALAMLVRYPVTFLGAGLDAWVILLTYVILLRAIQKEEGDPTRDPQPANAHGPGTPIRGTVLWAKFAGAAAVVVVAGWFLSGASDQIATMTGLGQTFVGGTLLAAATSLPELVVTVFTIRAGALDLAIGNVLGSNTFNILILVVCDFALPGGAPILSVANHGQLVADVLGLKLAGIVIVGLALPRPAVPRRMPWEIVAIGITYLIGLWLLYQMR